MEKCVRLLEVYCSSTQACIRAYNEESADFVFDSDVLQGCAPLLTLFSYAINWIMRHGLHTFRGIQLGHVFWVTDPEFADNIVVLGEEPSTVQPVLDQIVCEAMTVGLTVTTAKTEFFTSRLVATF